MKLNRSKFLYEEKQGLINKGFVLNGNEKIQKKQIADLIII